MSDARPPTMEELDRSLTDLASRLVYPPTPDLTYRVRLQIAGSAVPHRRGHGSWSLARPWSGRMVVGATLLLLLGIAIAMAATLPQLRSAVADRLGLPGIRIVLLRDRTAPPPTPAGQDLLMGTPVSLELAAETAPFPLRVPALPELAVPDAVYRSGDRTEMISFVYRARDDLPAAPGSSAGALLTQFRGEPDRPLIEKGLAAEDIDPDVALTMLTVNGQPGYWIEGAHAFFLYRDVDGEVRRETYRLATNALLWQQDGITYRLEADISRDRAVRIAESMQPFEAT